MQNARRQPTDHGQEPTSLRHQLPLVTFTGRSAPENIYHSDLSKQLDTYGLCVRLREPSLKHQAVIATHDTLYALLSQFNCVCLQKHNAAAHNSTTPSITHPRFTVKLYVHPAFQSPARAMQASIQPASRMQFLCLYYRCTQVANYIT